MSPRRVVFLGPSLPREEALAILGDGWTLLPPARMGDVYRLLGPELEAVVLVDGVFHGEPAIWHRELLAAVDGGVAVYGASSMGALRAAELGTYGMIGVGRVHAWYRDGVVEGDDEVALHHGPEETGWVGLSVPLVNTRATVESAVAAGALEPGEGEAVVEAARARWFPERTPERLRADLLGSGWPEVRVDRVAGALIAHATDLKRADARAVLRRAAADAEAGGAASGDLPVRAAPDRSPPVRWRKDRLLRAEVEAMVGADRLAGLAELDGLRRRVVLEAVILGTAAPGATDTAVALADDGELAATPTSTPLPAGLLPHEAARLRADRARLEVAAGAAGGLEAAAAAALVGLGATLPAAEVVARGPDAVGLPWEEDVALLEAWQADALLGPPAWGPDAREAW